jgi:hypothetical protein
MKESFSSHSKDTFSTLFVKDFGMTTQGKIDISYSVTPQTNVSSYIVLVAVTENQRQGWYSGIGQSDSISTVCNQPSLLRILLSNDGNITWAPPIVGQYSLIVMQCRPSSDYVKVSLNVDMQNVLSDGSRSYLAVEDVMLIRLFQGELLIYSLLIAGLLGQYYFRR